MLKIKTLITIIALSFSQVSLATIFQFEDTNANNGGMSDRLETVGGTFNDVTQAFTWDATFNADPTDVDGFWLVVNNGPNPKSSDVNELAIMYGDMSTGRLSTFVYNGQNNSNSLNNPAIWLQEDLFSVTSNSFSLSIDTTTINSWSSDPEYTGISFDDNIGIWFHISRGSTFAYDQSNILDSYTYAQQGWYDKAGLTTTRVPEPVSLMLMGLGLIGLGARRKR